MVWLSADWETPSCAAALVKLRSFATARKANRSLTFSRYIERFPWIVRRRFHAREIVAFISPADKSMHIITSNGRDPDALSSFADLRGNGRSER